MITTYRLLFWRLLAQKWAYEGLYEGEEEKEVGLGLRVLTVLAIATSIDALAVGATLRF